MPRPLLYIHGFASSAHSHKASVLRRHCNEVYAPSLSHIPTLAVETLAEFIRALPQPPLLIGSSLGGFYALHLSQRFALPAVLVNPVVKLEAPLARVVGMNRHYFDDSQFEFTEDHLQSLQQYACPAPDTRRLLLMVELGDELIDHRDSLETLAGAQQVVSKGGDHGYAGFEAQIGTIRAFAERFGGVR
jgi:predicted esterase YcpF (UPF0227 family)